MRGTSQRAPVDDGPGAVGQGPGDVAGEAAAGDVGDGVHVGGADGRQHGRGVDDRRPEQLVGERRGGTRPRRGVERRGRPARAGRAGPGCSRCTAGPGDGRPTSTSPGRTRCGAEDLVLLDHPDGEADQVELARLHDPGVLGHLAAEQGGADLAAALGHPGHQLGHLGGLHRPGRDVVEEEQRLGSLAHQVVDAHGHQVDADGVEAAELLGHHQLGAHPVGGRHQDRPAVARPCRGRTDRRSRRGRRAPRDGGWRPPSA